MKKIFISMPYTDENPEVTDYRIRIGTRACARLRGLGFSPVCPCVFGHQFINLVPSDAVTYRDWLDEAKSDIERCDIVFVLMVDGWDKSSGVQEELKLAEELGKPVFFYSAWEERMEDVVDEIVVVFEGTLHSEHPTFLHATLFVADLGSDYTVGYMRDGIFYDYNPVHTLPIQP